MQIYIHIIIPYIYYLLVSIVATTLQPQDISSPIITKKIRNANSLTVKKTHTNILSSHNNIVLDEKSKWTLDSLQQQLKIYVKKNDSCIQMTFDVVVSKSKVVIIIVYSIQRVARLLSIGAHTHIWTWFLCVLKLFFFFFERKRKSSGCCLWVEKWQGDVNGNVSLSISFFI